MSLMEVNQISFSYPHQGNVFTNVNFTVKAGDILTFLGPNGVGKSTLLKCLLGFNKVNAGTICLNHRQLDQLSPRAIARQVAYVPQNYQISTGLSVTDYLLTARNPYLKPLQVPGNSEHRLVQKYLADFDLTTLADQRFSSLSGGQQQIVTIIKALIQTPSLLILDEPMAALDLKRQREVMTILKKLAHQGMAIVLTTHLPDHVFLLDSKVGLFFPNGELKVGTSSSLMTTENLEKIYQTPLELTYLPTLHRYTCQLKV